MSEKFGISQPMRRREDARFLTGRGTFADDVAVAGQAYAAFVRADHSHAEIRAIDTAAAAAMPGVLGVFTGEDLRAAGVGFVPCMPPPPGVELAVPVDTPRPGLAQDRVRHVGEAIALVVADTEARAIDAADRVIVDLAELPAVVSIADALAPGAPLIWDAAPGNVGLEWRMGERAEIDAAFAAAAHVTRLELVNNRLVGNPMEPRTSIATWKAAEDCYELVCSSQGVNYMIRVLCEFTFDIPREQMHVLTHDVGGGFGIKEQPYPEDVAILYAARALDRPVKWRGTRAEHFLADNHARDALIDCALALDGDGDFLAVRATILDAMGAYFACHGPFISIRNTPNGLPLLYRTPLLEVDVKLVMTNTVPVGPYRGAGREQAAYIMERLIDEAARETGIDRIELRRRNFIPPEAMPYTTPAGRTYDSGEFETVMDKALALADWDGFADRRAASEAAGKLRGRGIACVMECVGAVPIEGADIRFTDDGRVALVVAAQSQGQGHETTMAQVVATRLGIANDIIDLRRGDSFDVPVGLGTIGSRSMVMVGSAIAGTCDAIVEKGRRCAAHMMEVAEVDIEFADGEFRVAGTDHAIGILELAAQVRAFAEPPAGLPASLDAAEEFNAPEQYFPNGCHICEVEIDPQTGNVAVERHCAVDDVGVVVNPMIVAGQVQGGLVQGLGQALREHCVYDDAGQLVTGSFMDYAMPRAADVPPLAVANHEVPSPTNPLGVKGVGEAGMTGAVPVAINAVVDALAHAGAPSRIDMPANSEKVWRALNAPTR